MDSSELSAPPRIRLQRFLASCGLGSRRACEEFITEGRVTVDGETVSELGATVHPASQVIALDGERLKMERKRYFALHKPPGYLCTNHDPAGRRRAIDLLPSEGPRLFSVGRLDENSTGLLIVTNDGDLAEKLAHPRHQIFRTYHLQVAGHPTGEKYEALKAGLRFAEGKFRVRSVKSFKKVGQSTWLEVVLSEGHNRELRRLFARVGHKVLKLTRISFGPIRLGKLKMGEFRPLSMQELEALHGLLARTKAVRSARPASQKGRAHSDDDEEVSLFDSQARTPPEQQAEDEPRRKTGPRPKFSSRRKPSNTQTAKSRPGGPRPGGPRPATKSKPDGRPKKSELFERRARSESGEKSTERGRPGQGKTRPRSKPPRGPKTRRD